MINYTQWSWSGGWRWSSTCSRIKAARPSSSGWRGLEQALGGGWRSSENSVYVAFLKSRRSFTGLGEHHWWKYMHCDQMLERLPKHCIFLPIIKARMPLCNWGMIKRDMWSELVGGWGETVRQRCLTRDCNLPRWPRTHSLSLVFPDWFWKVQLLDGLAFRDEPIVPHWLVMSWFSG